MVADGAKQAALIVPLVALTNVGNVSDMVLVLYNGFEINGVEFHTSIFGTLPAGFGRLITMEK
jgi:hypothetical protein